MMWARSIQPLRGPIGFYCYAAIFACFLASLPKSSLGQDDLELGNIFLSDGDLHIESPKNGSVFVDGVNITRIMELVVNHLPLTSCIGATNGAHTIYPLGLASSPVNTLCDNGWAIIDPSRDDNWRHLFNSWTTHNTSFDSFKGPTSAELKANKYLSFLEWFKLDAQDHNFALSQNCRDCTSQGKIFVATSDYLTEKCSNIMEGQCDMTSDYVCYECANPVTGQIRQGSCTHAEVIPSAAYRNQDGTNYFAERDCQKHYYHSAPAIGTLSRGCVCYKPDNALP